MKINNPQFFYDEENNKVGVLISYEEFIALMEQLEDLQDIYMAHIRTKKKGKVIPFEKIKEELFSNAKK